MSSRRRLRPSKTSGGARFSSSRMSQCPSLFGWGGGWVGGWNISVFYGRYSNRVGGWVGVGGCFIYTYLNALTSSPSTNLRRPVVGSVPYCPVYSATSVCSWLLMRTQRWPVLAARYSTRVVFPALSVGRVGGWVIEVGGWFDAHATVACSSGEGLDERRLPSTVSGWVGGYFFGGGRAG